MSIQCYGPATTAEQNGYQNIDGRDALQIYESRKDEFVWLDVRTEHEYNDDHIPGAKLVPLDELEQSLTKVGSPNQKYIVYCHSGGRSVAACEFLAKNGYKQLWNLMGGIGDWTGPVEGTD